MIRRRLWVDCYMYIITLSVLLSLTSVSSAAVCRTLLFHYSVYSRKFGSILWLLCDCYWMTTATTGTASIYDVVCRWQQTNRHVCMFSICI